MTPIIPPLRAPFPPFCEFCFIQNVHQQNCSYRTVVDSMHHPASLLKAPTSDYINNDTTNNFSSSWPWHNQNSCFELVINLHIFRAIILNPTRSFALTALWTASRWYNLLALACWLEAPYYPFLERTCLNKDTSTYSLCTLVLDSWFLNSTITCVTVLCTPCTAQSPCTLAIPPMEDRKNVPQHIRYYLPSIPQYHPTHTQNPHTSTSLPSFCRYPTHI